MAPSNSEKICLSVLAHRVGQDVEPAAVRHPHHDFVDVVFRRPLDNLFDDGERRLPAFEREPLLAHKARVQKMLELFGRDEIAQDADALIAVERPVVGFRLHAVLQPALLLRHLDVHVLAADLAAVRLAQRFQNLSQRGDRLGAALADRFAQRTRQEFAVEVPDGEAVGFRIEFRMVAGLDTQRIEVGNEMPAHPVRVDHLDDAGFLGDLGVARGGQSGDLRLAVGDPAYRLVRHAQVLENLLVKSVVAVQQFLHLAQERAGFGALNDAVIVGAGDRHHLADTDHRAGLLGGAPVFGRVVDGARRDNRALARHQPRSGGHGPHRARIGQGKGGSLKVGGCEFGRARAAHQVVEGREVFLKVEVSGVLDIRHHQAAGAVPSRDIHRDSQVDVLVNHAERLSVLLVIGVVEGRNVFEGFDQRPPDDVGVGDFAAPYQPAMLIDDPPVLIHHFDGDGALRGRERNGERGRHILRNAPRRAAQWLKFDIRGRRRSGGWRSARWRCRSRRNGRGSGGRSAILLEDALPAFVDRRAVVQILLI